MSPVRLPDRALRFFNLFEKNLELVHDEPPQLAYHGTAKLRF